MEFLISPLAPRMSATPPFSFLRNPSASPRKLYMYRPFSIYLIPTIFPNTLKISAHLSRPTNRRNYLRKKLTQHRQFHQVTPLQIPVREFCENDDCKLKNADTSVEQSGDIEQKSSLDDDCSASGDVEVPESKSMKKQFGGSILLNQLEGWVEQYKKDSEFWGIGTGHIFTVFQDSDGKVERVVVNEDEIMRRSGVDPRLQEDDEAEAEDLAVVNYKFSFAKDLAKEMESGGNVIMKDSSVAKFVLPHSKSGVREAVRGVMLKPSLLPRMSRAGVIVLCGFFVVWAIKGLFGVGEDSEKHKMLEKGISRRKLEARKEKENMMKGGVEVIQDPTEPASMPFKRPQLDKLELLNSIISSKGSNYKSTVAEYSKYQSKDFEDDIQQIRAMARHAREIEKGDSLPDTVDENDSLPDTVDDENDPSVNAMSTGNTALPKQDTVPVYESYETDESDITKTGRVNDMNLLTDDRHHQSDQLHGSSSRTKLRIIKSVREAREYLSRKHHKLEINREPEASKEFDSALAMSMPIADNSSCNTIQTSLNSSDEVYDPPSMIGHDYLHRHEDYKGIETVNKNAVSLDGFQKSRTSSGREVGVNKEVADVSIDLMGRERESNQKKNQTDDCKNEIPSSLNSTSHSTTAEVGCGGSISTKEVITQVIPGTTIGGKEDGKPTELTQSTDKGSWIEKNFHEFEPLVKRMAVGFRDNYVAARERSNNGLNSGTDLAQLKTNVDEQEFEWMKDERLKEIVFKVRDNELSGRDPFHLVGDEDKYAFFSGLEKKVEHENEKLMKVHAYFHENIENLDYGADGISLYDPPEKIMPRWKVSPAEKNPESLNNFVEQRKALVPESLKNSFLTKNTGKDAIHKPKDPSSYNNQSSRFQNKIAESSKTVIAGSDGSVKAGKKSGREYWQHTKKWSEGFLESYEMETDPEVKAVMKDIGKDLDRWITEKEIKEAADFMDKLPEKGQKLIKQKLEKVKREMELFGPQAVVSKYREYSEEKEEDYLWWLDLPFVLCIELYTMDNGEHKVGFYSLEMGTDLELNPKQYHVIAFEDVADCKNLCYIIQAHMEMLGNGNAFLVSRPPKDAYREAKANGFGVTVVRKGQLRLNIDQTLEEVEEMIEEIGSKIYHDKIMKDRSVDIKALMKGVFGINHPAKRKKKRRVKP